MRFGIVALSSGVVLAVSIAVALAGTPFGGDDTGTIPSDAPKGPITKCENGVGKAVAKLVGALGKCHAARAIGKLPDDAAEDTCKGAALTKFNTTKTAGCSACTNITATGSAVEALTDANNGQVYCKATGTPFGGDDTGNVPSDAPKGPVTKCENNVGKSVSKLVSALLKCHAGRASGKFTNEAAEETCETTALNKFGAIKTAGCDPCTNLATLGSTVESRVDGTNSLIYCDQLTCPWTGPAVFDPTVFAACSPACSGAHCVPAGIVPSAEQSLLAACTDGLCAPDAVIAAAGEFVPNSCVSIAGAEGRCLSTCLPSVAGAVGLPQSVCAAGERCMPCFNPTASDPTAATGACSFACDAPTNPPTLLTCPWTGPAIFDPATFTGCCGGSHCVPTGLLPGLPLSPGACTTADNGAGECVPDKIIAKGGQVVPKSCTSIAGAEGRCLSSCLPAVAEAFWLPQGGCDVGERCMPCYDPIANPDAPTGACSFGCDAPSQDPVRLTCPWNGGPVLNPAVFPGCCSGAHCLPASFVPVGQRSLFASCTDGFCVPDSIIATAGAGVPPSCVAFAGTTAEGRCLSTCLPGVAAQPSLETSSCAAGSKCAPCTDPYTGASTGSCSMSCDNPTQPAFTFPGCCPVNATLTGTCVPSSQVQVPAAQQSSLEQDDCPSGSAGYLCVPHEYLPGGTPSTCTATFPIPGPGACVSRCTNLGTLSFLPQADCPDNDACVPCSLAPTTPGCG